MIRHVVLWRLKSNNGDSFHVIQAALQAQLGRVPGLLRIEVRRNFADATSPTSRRALDFALVCDFESREALTKGRRACARQARRGLARTRCEAASPAAGARRARRAARRACWSPRPARAPADRRSPGLARGGLRRAALAPRIPACRRLRS